MKDTSLRGGGQKDVCLTPLRGGLQWVGFKVPNTPRGQFWDLRGHLEVKCIFCFEINVVQWISCRTKEKVSLYLNSKCLKHPQVNFGTLEVI